MYIPSFVAFTLKKSVISLDSSGMSRFGHCTSLLQKKITPQKSGSLQADLMSVLSNFTINNTPTVYCQVQTTYTFTSYLLLQKRMLYNTCTLIKILGSTEQ